MKVLLTGATGYLGQFLVRALLDKEHQVVTLGRRALPDGLGQAIEHISLSADRSAIPGQIELTRPDVVIHTAAVASAGVCEDEPDLADDFNFKFTADLSNIASELGIRMVYTSTDLAFEGIRDCPLDGIPADFSPCPLSVYARSKVRGEQAVLGYEKGIVARLSLLFGPPAPYDGKSGPAGWMIEALKQRRELTLFEDEWRAPVYVGDAANFLVMLALGDPQRRIYHISGPERLSRVEMGEKLANLLGADRSLITRRLRRDVSSRPVRPADVSLSSSEFCAEFKAQPKAIEEALDGLIC